MAVQKKATARKATSKKTGASKVKAKAARKKTARQKNAARKRLTPAKQKRGLQGSEVLLSVASPEVSGLVAGVESVGGTPVGAYREPLSGHPMLLATLPIPAFAAYYLKAAAGVPSSEILAYTAVQFVGQFAGAWSIRHWLDRIPIRRFFQLASGVVIGVCLVWLGILSGDTRGTSVLWLAYALFGVAIGLSQAAHFTYLPELAVPEKRPVTLAIFGAVVGVLSGLAPTLWGLALRSGSGTPGIDQPTFALFFATSIVMCVVGIGLLRSLPDVRPSLSEARR
jgi:hypothetical protein